MNYLFIHQNFPGQFKFVAPALAAEAGHAVVALTMRRIEAATWRGVRVVPYGVSRGTTPGVHPWISDLETKVIRGEACFRAARALRDQGFAPDVIVSHPGWGESLFVREVWPKARLGLYCEFYYQVSGADVGFDPEFAATDPGDVCRIRLKNVNNLLHFEAACAGLSPTSWQAGTFPEPFRRRITVMHEGIDTEALRPNPAVSLTLGDGTTLTRADEVVTFVNRNLEPYRGFHVFMRALPELLRRRPRARVLLVGGDGASYSAPKPGEPSWKARFIREVRPSIPAADWARVHFVGRLPYDVFIGVLQLSAVHVYLTYPLVLSWSLLEAMSLGCAVVASDTSPLHEVIGHDVTGRLVDFFDRAGLVREICALLDDPAARARLGAAARELVRERYDLNRICLPGQLAWVRGLADGAGCGG